MTREEAIKTLKENYCAMCAYGSQDMDSCDIHSCDNKDAIKALEQEPCEDAISRQAALEKAINVPIAKVVTEDKVIYRKIIFADDIKNLPPITSQQKNEDIAKAFQFGLAFGFGEKYDEMDRVIDEIKKALTPQQEWISVSERLPQKGEYGKVLVTYVPSGGTLWTTVIIAHYSDLMGIAKPSFHIGEVGKESFQNITKQVIAWMPLPKPYKAESEDRE